MAKVDLARRAKIGSDRRARTRAQILDAGAALIAEGLAPTADSIAEAAGVAKGTFYYHFDNVDQMVAAVSAQLGQSFDDVVTPGRTELQDPIARLSFVFTQSLEKAISDTAWARLMLQSSQRRSDFGRSVRGILKADIADAIAHGRLAVRDPELAVDIFLGIWLQVTHGFIERAASLELISHALEAALRALGNTPHANRNF